jgi:hypothetical protein
MRILSVFKSQFDGWYTFSLRNLIVEVTECSVEVWKVVQGTLQRLDFISFSQPEWQARLSALIRGNNANAVAGEN